MSVEFKKISIIGLGYIGLPTAAMLASKGISVIGVDIAEHTVNTINAGKIHILEPDLHALVQTVVNTGMLRATTMPESADAFLITVPTPFKNNHEPDLSFVEAAVASIAPVLRRGNLIILESTSPVGTTEHIAKQLAQLRKDLVFPHDSAMADIAIAYCPERVMPGHILRELVENDRIIGGITKTCSHRARALYQLFTKGICLITNSRTAEMTKLTENAFRDVNVAFANELSIICHKLKINVWELIKLANHHPRVNILQPGTGVGGHCIAVDPWFIVNAAQEEAKLIRTAREVNDSKPKFVLDKIHAAAGFFQKPTIACLGLSYKANTDDLRESPAVEIVKQLSQVSRYELLIVEPHIENLPDSLSCLSLVSLERALEKADIIVLLVNHQDFAVLPDRVSHDKVMINFANDFEPSKKTYSVLKDSVLPI